MVISSGFRIGQYRDDNHREDARCVTHLTLETSSFYFRVVVCSIRLFPTLISKIKWGGSELPIDEFLEGQQAFLPPPPVDFIPPPPDFQQLIIKMEPDSDLGYFQGGMIPPDHPIQHLAQLDPSMLRHLGSHQLPVLHYISKYTLTR